MKMTLTGVLLLVIAANARAELTPDQVAILAMASSESSRRLAEYYADVRGVPKSQILFLGGEPKRTVSRETWQQEIRPAIRAWLSDNDLETTIRCLVTCWDVPLQIDRRRHDTPEVVVRKDFLARSRGILIGQLADLIETIGSVTAGDGSPERPELAADAKVESLAAQLDAALKAAGVRLQGIESEAEKKLSSATLERAFVVGGGISGLLQLVARGSKAEGLDANAAGRVELFKGRRQGLNEGLQALDGLPGTISRDAQMLRLIQKTSGLLGSIRWIDAQQEKLRKNDTSCSFDSELSLLYWPNYTLFGWQPNLLHYRYDKLRTAQPPPLMVSRLAAPTLRRAMDLVDAAVEVEKTGLSGKVYLDARGIPFDSEEDKRGSYGEYDQSLRDLARRLSEHTDLEVVLNEEAQLFGEGDCPDAALYCGWYSLAKYIDAFDWCSGAVGYHMASSEATSLRTPGGKVWCNAMLEDGVAATLGPVHEPLLGAFPLPDDFFSVLLTGRYTLVETFYRTKPFNSWAMVLVGDPLYNPFKNHPQLNVDDLPERLRQTTSARLGAAHGEP